MTSTSGGEAIVNGLVAHGVDTVFGLPGAQIYGLFDAFHQAQLKVIGARHEQACGYMAYGYARSSGKPGVFSVVPGPGVLNAGAAMLTALGVERAGAVPDRPGADRVPRQGPRPSARDAGPARDAADLRQMGRADRISRCRAGAGLARVPGNAVGPPRPGRAGNAVGRVHAARGRRRRQNRSIPSRRRSPTPSASRPRPAWSPPARRR